MNDDKQLSLLQGFAILNNRPTLPIFDDKHVKCGEVYYPGVDDVNDETAYIKMVFHADAGKVADKFGEQLTVFIKSINPNDQADFSHVSRYANGCPIVINIIGEKVVLAIIDEFKKEKNYIWDMTIDHMSIIALSGLVEYQYKLDIMRRIERHPEDQNIISRAKLTQVLNKMQLFLRDHTDVKETKGMELVRKTIEAMNIDDQQMQISTDEYHAAMTAIQAILQSKLKVKSRGLFQPRRSQEMVDLFSNILATLTPNRQTSLSRRKLSEGMS